MGDERQYGLCPDEELSGAMAVLRDDDEKGLAELDRLLAQYSADPRLHFLKGSVLAGGGRIEEAHASMGRAVEIAPAFRIARFQLGFLQYTSGDAAAAAATWEPLHEGAPDDPLPRFVAGLEALAGDRFDEATDLLRQGIALNRDNPPLNADMTMLIDAIRAREPDPAGPAAEEEEEPLSLTQLALRQSAAKSTRH